MATVVARVDRPGGGVGTSCEGADVTTDVTAPEDLIAAAREGRPVIDPVLDECDLRETDLAGLDLRGGSLAGADLRGARLDRARISGTELAAADLREVDLTDAVLTRVDLSGARFAGATLGDTRFDGCRMIGTILRGMRGLTASFVLTGCTLQLADLGDLVLRGLRISECDLSEADLSGADLRTVEFVRCRLRATVLRAARLDAADLRTCDLGEITPDTPQELRGAIISPAQANAVCAALGLTVLD